MILVISMMRSVVFSLWFLVSLLPMQAGQAQGVFGATDWAQFGALGILAGVMLYLLNQQNKQHRDELVQIYERHKTEVAGITARADSAAESHKSDYKDLVDRALAVSETTGETMQKLHTAITDIHQRIDAEGSMEKLREEIRQFKSAS